MDKHLTRLDFQINRLGYRFKSVDLLLEALTHSLHQPDLNPHFYQQNRTFNRLQIVGSSVLKAVVSLYVIKTSGVTDGEGDLTLKKSRFIDGQTQISVGKLLLLPNDSGLKLVSPFVRTQSGVKNDSGFVLPYDKFVKAVFGAVFIDAGGSAGEGVAQAELLFRRLWKPFLSDNDTVQPLRDSFPQISPEIMWFWRRNGMFVYASILEERIGVKFSNINLACEAIIHKSFYDPIRNNPVEKTLLQPDYQRLEFLGDCVLELIIAEFVHIQFAGFNETGLGNKIQKYANAESQFKIANKLELESLVRMDDNKRAIWSKLDDIVESVIGALYVDGGLGKAKPFVLSTWGLEGSVKSEPGLDDLESKLGYKFRNKEVLVSSLTHESGSTSGTTEQALHTFRFLKDVGTSIIGLFAAEYVVLTAEPNAKLTALKAHENHLVGKKTLSGIAEFLELKHHSRLPAHLVNGKTPLARYEQFVCGVIGAVFVDADNCRDVLVRVFYRLWNPYLKHCPKSSLSNCFPSSLESQRNLRSRLGFEMSDEVFQEIEDKIRYSFKNRNLLEQVLTNSESRRFSTDKSVGDETRFYVIGQRVLSLFSMGFFCKTRSRELLVEDMEFLIKHVNSVGCGPIFLSTVILCILLMSGFDSSEYFMLDAALLKRVYVVPPNTDESFELGSRIIRHIGILGAAYVDVGEVLLQTLFQSLQTFVLNRPSNKVSTVPHSSSAPITTAKPRLQQELGSCASVISIGEPECLIPGSNNEQAVKSVNKGNKRTGRGSEGAPYSRESGRRVDRTQVASSRGSYVPETVAASPLQLIKGTNNSVTQSERISKSLTSQPSKPLGNCSSATASLSRGVTREPSGTYSSSQAAASLSRGEAINDYVSTRWKTQAEHARSTRLKSERASSYLPETARSVDRKEASKGTVSTVPSRTPSTMYVPSYTPFLAAPLNTIRRSSALQSSRISQPLTSDTSEPLGTYSSCQETASLFRGETTKNNYYHASNRTTFQTETRVSNYEFLSPNRGLWLPGSKGHASVTDVLQRSPKSPPASDSTNYASRDYVLRHFSEVKQASEYRQNSTEYKPKSSLPQENYGSTASKFGEYYAASRGSRDNSTSPGRNAPANTVFSGSSIRTAETVRLSGQGRFSSPASSSYYSHSSSSRYASESPRPKIKKWEDYVREYEDAAGERELRKRSAGREATGDCAHDSCYYRSNLGSNNIMSSQNVVKLVPPESAIISSFCRKVWNTALFVGEFILGLLALGFMLLLIAFLLVPIIKTLPTNKL